MSFRTKVPVLEKAMDTPVVPRAVAVVLVDTPVVAVPKVVVPFVVCRQSNLAVPAAPAVEIFNSMVAA